MNNSLYKEFCCGSLKPLFRYGVVGIINNLLGFLAYLLMTSLGVESKVAMTCLYLIVLVISFFGNRQWAFEYQGDMLPSGIRYFVAHFFGYLLNLALLFVLVDKYGYPHQQVQAVAIFIVAGFLFVSFKFFVFRSDDASTNNIE